MFKRVKYYTPITKKLKRFSIGASLMDTLNIGLIVRRSILSFSILLEDLVAGLDRSEGPGLEGIKIKTIKY